MRWPLLIALIANSLCVSTCVVHAQQQEPTREQLQTQIQLLKEQIAKRDELIGKRDSSLYAKYEETRKKQYEFEARLMELNVETLRRQWLQTYAVMIMVIVVVLAGVCFSAFQLWKSVGVAGVQLTSELEASASRVRINSSVVGVVVLVISLVFLYLYIDRVYQVTVVDLYKPSISQP